MNRVITFFVFLCFSVNLYSIDFYIWYDDAGIKHVSTHPRECMDENNKNIKLKCQISNKYSVQVDPDIVRKEIEKVNRTKEKDKQKQNLISAINRGNCDSLTSKEDRSICNKRVRVNVSNQRNREHEKRMKKEQRDWEKAQRIREAKVQAFNKESEERLEKARKKACRENPRGCAMAGGY